MLRIQIAAILCCVVLIGLILRIANISPYKFYPDAYQSLLVSKNIQDYKSVVGYLGAEGTVYPPFFMWSRPLYPLLIPMVKPLTNDDEKAALLVNLVAGTLSILAVFGLAYSVSGNKAAGLSASILLATSFNHTVWSGFILTEAVGVLFLTLTFWNFFANIRGAVTLFDTKDMLTGGLFSLSILTRYEFFILIIPILLYIWIKNSTPGIRTVNLLTSIAFPIIIVFSLFFPLRSIIPVIVQQVSDLALFSSCIALGSYIVLRKTKKLPLDKVVKYAGILGRWSIRSIWIIGIGIGVYALFDLRFPMFPLGPVNFFKTDIPIGISSLIGLTVMLRSQKKKTEAFFILCSLLLLSIVYAHVNLQIQRYSTNLIPLLIIPAAEGMMHCIRWCFQIFKKHSIVHARFFFTVIFILLLSVQISHTFSGIKAWSNGAWFKKSYEETSARSLKKFIQADDILITSLPEPYFFFTENSIHSVADKYPYIFIEGIDENKTVTIVLDMPMRDIFPTFTSVVEEKLGEYKQSSFLVHEPYRYTTFAAQESHPVQLYNVTLKELKLAISN